MFATCLVDNRVLDPPYDTKNYKFMENKNSLRIVITKVQDHIAWKTTPLNGHEWSQRSAVSCQQYGTDLTIDYLYQIINIKISRHNSIISAMLNVSETSGQNNGYMEGKPIIWVRMFYAGFPKHVMSWEITIHHSVRNFFLAMIWLRNFGI